MLVVVANIFGAIVIAITVLILTSKLIKKRTINKYIIPELAKHGLKLNKIQPLGFLDKGQFKTEKIHLRPFTLGYPIYDYYYNVTYVRLKDENVEFQITVKVSVFLLIIYRVEFSRPLKNH
ncbi:MAG TPA: hypothetical protein PLM56_19285 [Cyclobacteriaceae bacterium]|nr:hypothetical protein [Cyclobacteriaceae bacterium]HRF35653.1 hypothetical protein [Cyclobacteriaceae bacterium]